MGDLVDGMLGKLGHQHGPYPGWGQRGHGRRFGGIVEDTPGLWVGWVVDLSKRAGRDPLSLRLSWGEWALRLAYVDLTFGRRYYWRCPVCDRRCEAVYTLGGRLACRVCHHLGYRSQASRAGSVYGFLDTILGRRWLRQGRYQGNDKAGELVAGLAQEFRAKLQAVIDGLSIQAGEGIEDGKDQDRAADTIRTGE